MSEILFKSLKIENFLSIGEGSIELDNRGLLLIQGQNDDDPSANSNGSGKSSTVDALCWALFGTTARGQSGDKVVNRFEGKNCRVEVTFTLNEKTYTVTRYRKHSKGKNRLTLFCDGDDLTLGTDKLTQDLLERTIGCGQDVFTASIYAGQNNMPNLPAMTDKELKQLVERAAGIELLDAAYAIARERLGTAKTIEATAIAKWDGAAAACERQKQQIADLEERKKEWAADHERQVNDARTWIQNHATTIKDLKAEIEAIDEAGIKARIDELEQKLVEANKPPPTLTSPERPRLQERPGLPNEVNDLRIEVSRLKMAAQSHHQKAQDCLQQIKQLDSHVGTPCGECGKEYHKEDLEQRRAILVREARASKQLYDQHIAKYDEVAAKVAALVEQHEREVESVNDANARLEQEYDTALQAHQNALQAQRDAAASSDSTKLMVALRSEQSALQSVSNKRTQLASKIDTLREAKERFDKLRAQENPIIKAIEEAQKRSEEATEVEQRAKQEVGKAIAATGNLNVVAELYSPKGMRGEVLDSVTPFLNARTAQYLGALSDGAITAEWRTTGETGKGELREKFHIAVVNEHGAEDFDGLSGGEQRKVRISTAMALQDLVASRADRPIKLFIADEADDALDVSGLERLMGILDDKARHVGTVLIISHNDLADWVSNQITVVKSGGKSHIVEL